MNPTKFTLDSQYLRHDGGTKFYQVFRIRAAVEGSEPGAAALMRKSPVTVTHWGPIRTTAHEKPHRPSLGGQHQVHEGDNYSSVISAKRGRGYKSLEVSWGTTEVILGPEALAKRMVEHFGHKIAVEGILPVLGVTEDGRIIGASAEVAMPASVSAAPKEPEKPVSRADVSGWGEF